MGPTQKRFLRSVSFTFIETMIGCNFFQVAADLFFSDNSLSGRLYVPVIGSGRSCIGHLIW